MDALSLVQFETTAACPAKCLMCPHKTMKRKVGLMPMELIKKIVDETLDLGVPEIMPFLNGEPFADPRMFDILAYIKLGIKSRGLNTKIGIFTNIELLDFESIRRLFINFSDVLGYFEISFNGMTEENYKKVMGLDHFYQNLEKANFAIGFNDGLGGGVKIMVGMVDMPETHDDIPKFAEIFKEHAQVYKCFNWAGKIGTGIERTQPCNRVLGHMTILWNGIVALCCMDSEGEVELGNIETESISDIWERNQWMRDRHRNLDFKMPLCEFCNME